MHTAAACLAPVLRLRNQAAELERKARSALQAGCVSQDPQAIERITAARLAFDRQLAQLIQTLQLPASAAAFPADLSPTSDHHLR